MTVTVYLSDGEQLRVADFDHASSLDLLVGLAKGMRVPVNTLLGKAVEALDLGYSAGDFISSVTTADSRELLDDVSRRLLAREAGEGRDRPAAKTEAPEEGPTTSASSPRPRAARTRCPA